jgi:hypothetical protein
MKKFREKAYRLWGKSRVKWAWRKARLKPPERNDGRPPPPHQTMNDLLPQALKEYIALSQMGREPAATKEELLSLFRRRRGYTKSEQIRTIYRGEEVDYQHCCHGRKDGRSMPWDWIPCEKAIHPPEGWVIAFLGAKETPPVHSATKVSRNHRGRTRCRVGRRTTGVG